MSDVLVASQVLSHFSLLIPQPIGADFYALASDAMMNAIADKISELEEKNDPASLASYLRGETPARISVSEEHFVRALSKLTPSVSEQDIRRYEELRVKYS